MCIVNYKMGFVIIFIIRSCSSQKRLNRLGQSIYNAITSLNPLELRTPIDQSQSGVVVSHRLPRPEQPTSIRILVSKRCCSIGRYFFKKNIVPLKVWSNFVKGRGYKFDVLKFEQISCVLFWENIFSKFSQRYMYQLTLV